MGIPSGAPVALAGEYLANPQEGWPDKLDKQHTKWCSDDVVKETPET